MPRRSRSKMSTALKAMGHGHGDAPLFKPEEEGVEKILSVPSRKKLEKRRSHTVAWFKSMLILTLAVMWIGVSSDLLFSESPGMVQSSLLKTLLNERDKINPPLIQWGEKLQKMLNKEPDTQQIFSWKYIATKKDECYKKISSLFESTGNT